MAVEWNGDAQLKAIVAGYRRRLTAACSYLEGAIKQDIGQAGTLRYVAKGGRDARGRFLQKGEKTVYNFTHSAPGNPPYKQTGHLRRSITREVDGMVGRVGTNLKYGRYLELGTRRMKARPYLRPNFERLRPVLVAFLSRPMIPGELPKIGPSRFRSGVLGAGGRKAGY